jgi:uncharacterized protein (DUF362 family)
LQIKVSISRGEDPYFNTLKALDLIKDQIVSSLKDSRVLIKPNLVTAHRTAWESGAVTNPGVVKAVIDFLNFKLSPKEIVVGEGTSNGTTWEAYQKNHYLQFQNYRNVRLLDFNHSRGKSIRIINPLTGYEENLWISEAVFEFDYIVSVPVLKTHDQAIVSLSLKNMLGVTSEPWERACSKDYVTKILVLLAGPFLDESVREAISRDLEDYFEGKDVRVYIYNRDPSKEKEKLKVWVLAGFNETAPLKVKYE